MATEQALPSTNADGSQITMHERSAIESLLDRHIECLGLNDDGIEGEEGQEALYYSKVFYESPPAGGGKGAAASRLTRFGAVSSFAPHFLLITGGSSFAPHVLHPPSPGRSPLSVRNVSKIDLESPKVNADASKALPNTNEGVKSTKSTRSNAKCRISGDMADIDLDPPQTRFKVRRLSKLAESQPRGNWRITD
ncbi:hypothetical protein Z517_09352 [Fonsecaea pedrosoi CBS 271.37]|uniref:Uncharacterized protein n=1 Tax=Fonsecaea pedrosoi CBS 271.37 TaxID=1442368 RepID=A0A0D2G8A1_9EURO|nr:uncharacterized protein Z517_09352 [Fonsecaea pedrosoi CBS 271.37]KIW76908.1 hypothetical protein Z517_09352 [Fonsecaea pedrosoi CBS 271.37]